MRELKTATFEEISKTLCLFLSTTQPSALSNSPLIASIGRLGMVVEILGNHNVAAEDKDIAFVVIGDINITEL
jgi:hypothetical protein